MQAFAQWILVCVVVCGVVIGLHTLAAHPIHVTLTTIDLNPKTQALEISCKIFADDFEAAVNRANNIVLRLGSERELSNATALLFNYVKQHLRLNINGKPVTNMVLIGKETEGEAVWMYIEVPSALASGAIKRVDLHNTLLHELYDDQANLTNFSIQGQRKSSLSRKGQEHAVLEF
jgi:hypothetical protein